MEFKDYLVASGVTVEEDEDDPRVQPDYRDIINKFKASLKNNSRVWYSTYIEKRVQDLHSAEGWKTVKSKFLTYFNPIGSTKEQQIKAWKELKWKPEEEKLTDFVFRFSQLAHELGYSDEQQISHFVLCLPRGMYLHLEGARTVPDAVDNLRKDIALGGLEIFGVMTKPVQDDSQPTVSFMVMKDSRTQSSTEDTLRVVKESIHDSMYESSKTLVKQLDKIGDKLTNVVEVEAEIIQETTTEITTGIVVEITTTEIEVETVETTAEIEIEAEEEIYLIPEKEEEINLDLDQVKDILTEMTLELLQ